MGPHALGFPARRELRLPASPRLRPRDRGAARYEAEHNIAALRQRDPLTALLALNKAIYESFDYEAGRHPRRQSDRPRPGTAAAGVCQDFAHVMIAICRSWGVPARYVSGYLFTDRKHGDRSDPDATHAWVEVFLPSLRWVGLDPTNNTIAGERHIACAVGRDYSDVPPSRGVYKGEAESELVVGVSVRKARAALSDPEFLRVSRPGPQANRRVQPNVAAFEEQRRHQMQQQQQ
jgi:transglutaminase-like putative cysteine protease